MRPSAHRVPRDYKGYHVLQQVGAGSFGQVYKGRKKCSKEIVALKFMSKLNRQEHELTNIRREIEVMHTLDHPNIIRLLDWHETAEGFCVVTELAEGELFQVCPMLSHVTSYISQFSNIASVLSIVQWNLNNPTPV